MFKKGISPVISVVLLVAFAVIIFFIISGFVGEKVEETKDANEKGYNTYLSQGGLEVRISDFQIIDENTVKLFIDNRGNELEGILVRLIGTEGVELFEIEETLAKLDIFNSNLDFDNDKVGLLHTIEVFPSVGGEVYAGNLDRLRLEPISCAALLAQNSEAVTGVHKISPDGASFINVFCDMETDGGGWTALAANGDTSVVETIDPSDCYPLITNDVTRGCGDQTNLFNDFTLNGEFQSKLSWRHLLAVAYDTSYDEKLAYFAIDFGNYELTSEERIAGTPYVPNIDTTYGKISCTDSSYNIVHYTKAGTYTFKSTNIANDKGTIFGHDNVVNMLSSSRRSFGFTDKLHSGTNFNGYGIDDYQDGWSCGNTWIPYDVKGKKMVVLVR